MLIVVSRFRDLGDNPVHYGDPMNLWLGSRFYSRHISQVLASQYRFSLLKVLQAVSPRPIIMAQILDTLPSDASDTTATLCCYVNVTSKIQIARITNISDWYFERVVFPGQRLLFEAPMAALLEIHTGMMASAILSDTIPCDRLVLDENGNQLGARVVQPSTMQPSLQKDEAIGNSSPDKVVGAMKVDAAIATVAASE